MFVAFNGRGWLVPITAVASLAIADLAGLHDPKLLWSAVAVGGLADRYFGLKWNSAEGRLLQDLSTGEVYEDKPDHSFFWIKMQHWFWIKLTLVIAGLAFAMFHGR